MALENHGAEPLPVSGHPDDERLAEYVDGVLGDDDRTAVEGHLAMCLDCRTVVTESALLLAEEPVDGLVPVGVHAEPEPVRETTARRRMVWPVLGGLAAAACVFLAVRALLPGGPSGVDVSRPELQALVAAFRAEPTRPIEASLTGGFAYAPAPSATRGAEPRPLSADTRIALAAIEQTGAVDRGAPAQAALGAALLVQGDSARAIEALEVAIREEPNNPAFLSDLAAAYLQRATTDARPEDLEAAVTAADRAIAANPEMGEPRFNRALALERLGRREAALAAWADAVGRLGDEGWRAEAQRRAAALAR